MTAAGPSPWGLASVSVCSFLLVGSCLLCLCFSVALWFCYFQFETGCDSDSMADCEIEWTNCTHTCADAYTLTTTFYVNMHKGLKRHVAFYTHTPRVSGNVAGFP